MPKTISTGFALLLALFVTSCDIPTQGPDFSFDANIRAPLIFDKTFVFLGPDQDGNDALIDTTTSAFDSIFTVDPSNKDVYLIQEIDAFDFADVDNLVDPLDIPAIPISINIGTLTTPEFEGGFVQEVGVFESDAADAPPVPASHEPAGTYYPASTSDIFLTVKAGGMIIDGSSVIDYTFTPQTSNNLTFVLTNNSGQTLTDGTFAPGSIPRAIVEDGSGNEILAATFSNAPANGETATVTLQLASLTLPANSRYRFDVGTESGMAPITANPVSILLAASVPQLFYNQINLSNMGAQSGIEVSEDGIGVEGDDSFEAAVTSQGSVVLSIANELDVPLHIDELRVLTAAPVEIYPEGHIVLSTTGQTIPANGSIDIPIAIGQTALTPSVDVSATVSSPGSGNQVTLNATDAISFSVSGAVSVERLYAKPDGQTFSSSGTVAVSTDEISFENSGDYVELASGSLALSNLTNGLDVSLTETRISFPNMLVAPFSSSDSLVVTFSGNVDVPEQYLFSRIERNQAGRDILINLAGVRILPEGEQLRYNVHSQTEQAADTRVFSTSDDVSTTFAAAGLEIRTLSATIDPTEVDVTADVTSDGLLDLMNDAEASVTTLDGLQELQDFGLDGLSLQGTSLSFNIETNVQADAVLYGAFLGIDQDASQIYLAGTGENSVSAADPIASKFVVGGQQVDPANLIKFDIEGSSSAQKVARSVVLSGENSNIDEFVSDLPAELRFVGTLLIQPGGGHVTITQPVELEVGIGASVPLRISGSATFNKDVDADLSGLRDITDDQNNVSLNDAELVLTYSNGLPVGFNAVIELQDASGAVVGTIPAGNEAPLLLQTASVDESGIATSPSSGTIEIPMSAARLEAMAQAQKLGLRFNLTSASWVSRLRADDEIQVSVKGNFGVRISTGD